MNKPLALCVMLLAAIVPHAANGGNVEENIVISQPKMEDQATISNRQGKRSYDYLYPGQQG